MELVGASWRLLVSNFAGRDRSTPPCLSAAASRINEPMPLARLIHLPYRMDMKREPGTAAPTIRRREERADATGGFSLIELLVTALVIMILFTMYWGGNSGARQRSRQAACAQNLQKLHIALEIFGTDHAGSYPNKSGAKNSAEALDLLVPKYTADTSLFVCPATRDGPLPGGESIANRRISYAYYMGRKSGNPEEAVVTDRQIDSKSKTINQQVFSLTGKGAGNNHKKAGGNILFCDGHVEACPPNSAFSLVLTQGVVLLNP
jgi:prepilin-type processing-associated H-X9-DG protein